MSLIDFAAHKYTRYKLFKAVDLLSFFDCKLLIEQKRELKHVLHSGSYSNLLTINLKMGLIYLISGEYANSIHYFKEAINLNPELVLYFLGLCTYNKAKKLEKSGRISFSKKYYQQSIYYYKKALEQNTNSSIFKRIISFNLCIILMKLGYNSDLKTLINEHFNKRNQYFKTPLLKKEKPFKDLEKVIFSGICLPV